MAPRGKKRNAEASPGESKKTRRYQEESPSFGSSIVKIQVGGGASQQTFYLHKDVAIKFSDFLAAATRNGWKEATEGIVNLPEEEPDVFKIFEAFIYNGRIYSRKDGDRQSGNGPGGDDTDKEWARLALAWLLGDALQASVFKYAIVDTLIDKLRDDYAHPLDSFEDIYMHSVGGSPMKDLMVDIAIWCWDEERMVETVKSTDQKDFLADVIIKMSRLSREGYSLKSPFEEGSTCNYHEHGDAKPCYKTMFK